MVHTTDEVDRELIVVTMSGHVNDLEIKDIQKEITEYGRNEVNLQLDIIDEEGLNNINAFLGKLKADNDAVEKVNKIAVVTQKGLMQKTMGIQTDVLPTVPIRIFDRAEREHARDWLSATDSDIERGIEMFPFPEHDDIMGIIINGKITEDDLKRFEKYFEKMMHDKEKINLYMEYVHVNGVTLGAVWQDMKAYVKFFNHYNKIAIVSNRKWIEMGSTAEDFFIPNINMKHFGMDERVNAVKWLATDN